MEWIEVSLASIRVRQASNLRALGNESGVSVNIEAVGQLFQLRTIDLQERDRGAVLALTEGLNKLIPSGFQLLTPVAIVHREFHHKKFHIARVLHQFIKMLNAGNLNFVAVCSETCAMTELAHKTKQK